jgi:hypothetical protein
MTEVILSIRLAVRAGIWSRITQIEDALDLCTDFDSDVTKNLNDELDFLINKLRGM